MDNSVNFDTQYCTSYNSRFTEMSKLIMDNPEVARRGLKVRELKDDLDSECMVIAILFFKSSLKPSVLKRNNEEEKKKVTSYVDNSVKYYLQDRSGTLELVFTPGFNKLQAFLTGMVLGFVGTLTTQARFECSDVVFPVAFNGPKYTSLGLTGKILIVGNCLLNNGNIEKLKVISDYCHDRIEAVILIGDVFGSSFRTDLLEGWADDMNVSVFIVPGMNDPTTQMLPQHPLHKLLFSKDSVNDESNPSGRIFLIQNPGRITINKAETVILSNYIMDGVVKYLNKGEETSVSEETFIGLLEQLVMARHTVPIAPDTLSCVPYNGRDPFILDRCDVLLAGGCRTACSRIFRGTALVGIPDFDGTSKAVLFSLQDGTVEEISCPSL